MLGIDYGARRIGLALSDATATLASPWRMLQRPPSEAETLRMLITEITALANDDDGLEAVVVGWPRRLDGSPTDQTPIVETFARVAEGADRRARRSSRTSACRVTKRNRGWRVARTDWRKRKAASSMPRRRRSSCRTISTAGRGRTCHERGWVATSHPSRMVRWIKRLVLLVVRRRDRCRLPAAGGCIAQWSSRTAAIPRRKCSSTFRRARRPAAIGERLVERRRRARCANVPASRC